MSYISSGNSSQIGLQDRKVHSNRGKKKKKKELKKKKKKNHKTHKKPGFFRYSIR